MTIPLVQKGILSKVEQLRLEREVNEVEGKLKELIGGFQKDAMERVNETKRNESGTGRARRSYTRPRRPCETCSGPVSGYRYRQ